MYMLTVKSLWWFCQSKDLTYIFIDIRIELSKATCVTRHGEKCQQKFSRIEPSLDYLF